MNEIHQNVTSDLLQIKAFVQFDFISQWEVKIQFVK